MSFPFQISRTWRAHLYILPILTFSIIYNLPKFFELQVSSTAAARNVTDGKVAQTDDQDLLQPSDNILAKHLNGNESQMQSDLVCTSLVTAAEKLDSLLSDWGKDCAHLSQTWSSLYQGLPNLSQPVYPWHHPFHPLGYLQHLNLQTGWLYEYIYMILKYKACLTWSN